MQSVATVPELAAQALLGEIEWRLLKLKFPHVGL
jgi:hypothetical protein